MLRFVGMPYWGRNILSIWNCVPHPLYAPELSPLAIPGVVTNFYYLGKQVQKVVKCTQLLLLIASHTRRLTTGTITAWRLGHSPDGWYLHDDYFTRTTKCLE